MHMYFFIYFKLTNRLRMFYFLHKVELQKQAILDLTYTALLCVLDKKSASVKNFIWTDVFGTQKTFPIETISVKEL